MQVTIAKLSQEIDLDSGHIRNYIVLRLADGETLRADISDQSAEAIVRRFAESAALSTDSGPASLSATAATREPATEPRPQAPTAGHGLDVSSSEMGYPMLTRMPALADGADEDGVPQL